ncbi:MAG: MATE family efflux transporter [Phyllobacteriaceae bacterium]|nr:MATE family efflux transporter [Phyllobacteriaceae bacterium]
MGDPAPDRPGPVIATASTTGRRLGVRDVLGVAGPMTLGYLTTPLVGLVATGVVGRLGDAVAVGGVALGSVVFDLIFAAFAFLRAGTTGLTAQATGRGDRGEAEAVLLRALLVALVGGLALLALTRPIVDLGLLVVGGEPAVRAATRAYVETRLLAAPAILANYAIFGWWLGRGRAGLGLVQQTTLNLTNVAAALLMAFHWREGVVGVAKASVLAEAVALSLSLVLLLVERRRLGPVKQPRIFDLAAFRAVAVVNRDLTIRTFALIAAFAFFSRQSAAQGAVVLAANAVLEKFFLTASWFLDGFAASAETFVGRAVGSGDRAAFDRAVGLTTRLSGLSAAVAATVLALAGPTLIAAMTTSPEVIEVAVRFLPWVIVTPLAGFLAFQMDGVFIGATWTREMARMMLLSLIAGFAAWAALAPLLGNHGLWASFVLFLATRGFTLARVIGRRAAVVFTAA